MTPEQWARVLLAGRDAAEQEQIAVQTQPGHLPGVVAVALSAMCPARRSRSPRRSGDRRTD